MEVKNMINIAKADNQVIHYLKKTIENYNLKNKEISEATGITAALISNYVNNIRLPNKKNREKIWDYLHSIWQPGIVKLPENEHWTAPYYIPVEDVKNPFESWYDCGYHGNEPEDFEKWMTLWEENGEFKIVSLYENYKEFRAKRNLDGVRYNSIREAIVCDEDLKNYHPLEYYQDYQIIKGIREGYI